MKELGNTAHFIFFTDRIHAQIGSFDETGGGGKIAGQAKTAKPLTERNQAGNSAETVFRTAGSQVHILAEICGLKMEGRVIG